MTEMSPLLPVVLLMALNTHYYCQHIDTVRKTSLFITDYTYITKLLLLLHYGKAFYSSKDQDKPFVRISRKLRRKWRRLRIFKHV